MMMMMTFASVDRMTSLSPHVFLVTFRISDLTSMSRVQALH